MTKYESLKQALDSIGSGKMKVFGNSMRPILKSGSLLTFAVRESYAVGDIVFCKVHGRVIDAHKVVKKHPSKGYLIANNHGYENGWTHTIYAKVVAAEFDGAVHRFE